MFSARRTVLGIGLMVQLISGCGETVEEQLAAAKRAQSATSMRVTEDSLKVARATTDSLRHARRADTLRAELGSLERRLGRETDDFTGDYVIGVRLRNGDAARGGGYGISVVGIKGARPALAFYAGSSTRDWLAWDRLSVNVDGVVFELEVTCRKEMSTTSDGVRENCTGRVPESDERVIRAMSMGKSVRVRFLGLVSSFDITLMANEKRDMAAVLRYLSLYEELIQIE